VIDQAVAALAQRDQAPINLTKEMFFTGAPGGP
jgi:hypothetical protein